MITVDEFYQKQPLAIFGVSSTGKRFGAAAWKDLNKAGIRALAVNPKGGTVNGQPIYPSLKDLPEPAGAAVILTKGDNALQALEECAAAGLKYVWLQDDSDTPQTRAACQRLGLEPLRGRCILLRHGGFPHSLHRFFDKLFRRQP
ncbi:MAG: CoA-binding protein [Candidatus Zixiibacteriota bacterium]|nr:MAG: CoA-binding protein [candidate division Zixibacteria bacterium]